MTKYFLYVRGHRHEWALELKGASPEHVEQWRADGLRVNEVVNEIPQWWVTLGLPVRFWCLCQDVVVWILDRK